MFHGLGFTFPSDITCSLLVLGHLSALGLCSTVLIFDRFCSRVLW